MSLQRSSSAPHTVAALANTAQRQKLPRSKSYLHVEKHDERVFLKPLATGVVPLASASNEREDPFNLLGFFPPSDEKESWRWLHEGPGRIEERPEEEENESGSEETIEQVIKQEDKLGVLSLFTRTARKEAAEKTAEGRLLSAYELEEAGSWEAVYEAFCGRRRTASATGSGGAERGFGVLFFPGSS